MGFSAKAGKLAALAIRPALFATLLKHRVAATTDHVEALQLIDVATLLDVGANKGQFSIMARNMYPEARIEAFEPAPAASGIYRSVFAGDPRVTLHQVAVSDNEGMVDFFMADREDSSSLLPIGDGETAAYGVSGASVIQVRSTILDHVIDMNTLTAPVLMKIDVQGGELKVLQGIQRLEMIDHIYVELSFVPLYDGQPLADEVIAYMAQRGFGLAGVFNQSTTRQFGPTQADFLFSRR